MHGMKLFVALAILSFIIFSCGNNNVAVKESKEDYTNTKEYREGLALVTKNKCLTCHAIDQTITGPPYAEIGKKYMSWPDTIVPHLARKVISGGAGVWGQIFMTPHPNLSQEDAETMVRYILLLGKMSK
jgi:cytochrome c